MLKRVKALPAKDARIVSKKGLKRRTNAVINNCIETLNKHIEATAENGAYSAHTWLHNHSGVLTLNAMNIIADYFRSAGYSVKLEQTTNDPAFVEQYSIELNWENVAC